jgi:two-component sensor histidine kinase/PAS domain-containing protein
MGQPGAESTGLALLHAVGDGIIAATFLLVPVVLLYLYRRRGEGSAGEAALVKLFLLFIFAVGLVHFAAVLKPWMPGREFEGVLKGAAALLALATGIGLWWLAPHLVRVPSRDRLQAEIAAHLQTLDELKEARLELEARVEARTKELAQAKQRFEIALRGSPISVFSQDRDLRFTWAHNLPTGLKPNELIGKTDADILPSEAAKKIIAAKRKAMDTGVSQELEIDFALFRRERSFYFVIEPLSGDDGAIIGTASVAVDVTERKANEHHLRLLLRELTHRSKNLLAVIHAIARQTAARTTSVEDFLDRFGARLYAISCSHDLLVADDWRGASLRMLVEQQLEAHADRIGERIAIEGEDIMLKPEAVHNLGLALHELTANAEKYGSLSEHLGEIRIHWDYCEEAKKLKLVWQERGGPEVSPPERSGFGRAMLENVVGKALAGDVTLSFPTKGVRCEIVIPAAHVTSRG